MKRIFRNILITPENFEKEVKSSKIIKNHQKSSKIIKNHQKSSKIIKNHQKSSKIIKNHQVCVCPSKILPNK